MALLNIGKGLHKSRRQVSEVIDFTVAMAGRKEKLRVITTLAPALLVTPAWEWNLHQYLEQ